MKHFQLFFLICLAVMAARWNAAADSFEKTIQAYTGSQSRFKIAAEAQKAEHHPDGKHDSRDGDRRRGDPAHKNQPSTGSPRNDERRGSDGGPRQEERRAQESGARRSGGHESWERWSGHGGWGRDRSWVWETRGWWIWSGWAGAAVWASYSYGACSDYYSPYRNSCSLACSQTQQQCVRDCGVYASGDSTCVTACNNHVTYCYSGCANECGARIDSCWRR